MLRYYTGIFETVEINNSFYQLPKKKTLLQWKYSVARDFIFSIKASRYITHMKKLKDPKKSTRRFFARIDNLGKKAGPVLFQLPPKWRCNPVRLEAFIKVLPKKHRYAFEFRDEDWFNEEVFGILSKHGIAFCIYELAQTKSPQKITADFVYMRLHGPESAYKGKYSKAKLRSIAGFLKECEKAGKDVYCYFDNDESAYAAHNADELKKMIRSRYA